MKILFLLLQMPDEDRGSDMYLDLAEEFYNKGHEIVLMAPDNRHSSCYEHIEHGMRTIRVNSMPTQDVPNMIRKGIGLATIGHYFMKAYKRFLKNEQFDWIFMPTPPITLSPLAEYIKNHTGAKFYLILRDIHPQSVWSIGLLKYRWMYNYLDAKARKGYIAADLIGCMSLGNVNYIAKQYPDLDTRKLVILFNWLKGADTIIEDSNIRTRYNLTGKFVALFGGTIGKGQRIENIIFLADHYKKNKDVVFLVVGKGVEKERLKKIAAEKQLDNVVVMDFIPKSEYLALVESVDLGLITINENYAVPTCPSKAISYMALGIPILAMINPNSDYGQWIEDAGAGYWTEGSNKNKAIQLFDTILNNPGLRKQMGEKGKEYYLNNCTPECAYETMISQMMKHRI